MKMIEWSYSFNGENFEGRFATKEDAISEAKGNIGEDDGSTIFIGQIEEVSLGVPIEWLLDQLGEQAYEQAGEYAQDYMVYVKKEHQSELEKQLNDVLESWIKKHNYTPNFWSVVSVEEIRSS
jgi:hypothetical protein